MNISVLLNLLTSFFLTYLTIPVIVKISNAKHLFDVPDHRKLNKVVVPTLGGVAIFLGMTLSTLLFLQGDSTFGFRYLFVAILMMLFIGIKDDILIMSARKKLAVQIAAALVLVLLGNFRIVHVYGFASLTQLNDWLSIPLSVLFILFVINAINLIDGIDGLAAGIALFISSVLGTWFFLAGHFNAGIACFALSGSLLAFLRFNLWGGDNKVFMGDTGSLILGTFLATLTIKFMEVNYFTFNEFYITQAPLIALGLLIVPVTDTLRVFTIRIKNKRSPFSPDMNHIHHLLIRMGLTHIQASGFLVTYTVAFTLSALTLQQYLNITIGFVLMLSASFTAVALIYKRSLQISAIKESEQTSTDPKTIQMHNWNKAPEEVVAYRKGKTFYR
ncbi:glycosyltransferase family 4 protein [Gaoshiqia sp. Z1-71]|uniref:glycosyltransferase family 4 protein n=1 Tax=Gaoshiqia hydrogeniformans TaxID=3290090 RepID=UPI003BF8D184